MRYFYDIFKEDPMIADGESAVKELKIEYFIISIYLLLRHLLKFYVWEKAERALFLAFSPIFMNAGQRERSMTPIFSSFPTNGSKRVVKSKCGTK